MFSGRCDYDCMELLIKNGAKVNAKDFHSNYPIQYTCARGDYECTKLLIENG